MRIAVREDAQNVGGRTLLNKIEEFERENAEELAQMSAWNATAELE